MNENLAYDIRFGESLLESLLFIVISIVYAPFLAWLFFESVSGSTFLSAALVLIYICLEIFGIFILLTLVFKWRSLDDESRSKLFVRALLSYGILVSIYILGLRQMNTLAGTYFI